MMLRVLAARRVRFLPHRLMTEYRSSTAKRWHENFQHFYAVVTEYVGALPAEAFACRAAPEQPSIEDLFRRLGQLVLHDARVTVELSPDVMGTAGEQSPESVKESVVRLLGRAGTSLQSTLTQLDEPRATHKRQTSLQPAGGTIAEQITELIAKLQFLFGQAVAIALANGHDIPPVRAPEA